MANNDSTRMGRILFSFFEGFGPFRFPSFEGKTGLVLCFFSYHPRDGVLKFVGDLSMGFQRDRANFLFELLELLFQSTD